MTQFHLSNHSQYLFGLSHLAPFSERQGVLEQRSVIPTMAQIYVLALLVNFQKENLALQPAGKRNKKENVDWGCLLSDVGAKGI